MQCQWFNATSKLIVRHGLGAMQLKCSRSKGTSASLQSWAIALLLMGTFWSTRRSTFHERHDLEHSGMLSRQLPCARGFQISNSLGMSGSLLGCHSWHATDEVFCKSQGSLQIDLYSIVAPCSRRQHASTNNLPPEALKVCHRFPAGMQRMKASESFTALKFLSGAM